MAHPATTAPSRTDHVAAAARSRDHVDRLGDVLEVIALDALGRGNPHWPEPPGGSRPRSVIGGPVAAATDAAIERLVAELTREFDGEVLDLHRRVDDERRRAEFGYD
jgi:hypothetical protein